MDFFVPHFPACLSTQFQVNGLLKLDNSPSKQPTWLLPHRRTALVRRGRQSCCGVWRGRERSLQSLSSCCPRPAVSAIKDA